MRHGENYSEERLISDLRGLAEKLGHSPTMAEIDAAGIAKSSTYRVRFGGIRRAFEAANLKVVAHRGRTTRIYGTEEMLDGVRRVRDILGAFPSIAEYDRLRLKGKEASSGAIVLRIGGWIKLRNNLAHETFKSKDEILEKLWTETRKYKCRPGLRRFCENNDLRMDNVISALGSRRDYMAIGQQMFERVLLDDLRAMADKLGFVPRAEDLCRANGLRDYRSYVRYFGSYKEALARVGLKFTVRHRDTGYTGAKSKKSKPEETRERTQDKKRDASLMAAV